MKYSSCLAILTFFLGTALALKAQPIFSNSADSLWFMNELPFPVVSAEFNFTYKAEMLKLDSIIPNTPVPNSEKFPQSLDSLLTYFEKNPNSSDAALSIFFKYREQGNITTGERYLKEAIQLKITKSLEEGKNDELAVAAALIIGNYGYAAFPEVNTLLDSFTTRYPNNLAAWNLKILYSINQFDTLAAENNITKTLAINDLSADTYIAAMQLETLRNIAQLSKLVEKDSNIFIRDRNNLPQLNDYKRFVALTKKYPNSELPRLSLKMLQLIELYTKLIFSMTADFHPQKGAKPIQFKLGGNTKKQLLELEKYFLGLTKNKKNIQTYLPYKCLMVIELLLDNNSKSEEYYKKLLANPMSKSDPALHKLSALGFFMSRNYTAFCTRFKPILDSNFTINDGMLYARLLHESGKDSESKAYLEYIIKQHTPSVSTPLMGLVFFALKEGNLTKALEHLQSIASLPNENPLRDEDFYFYAALSVFLEGNKEDSKRILESIRTYGKSYDKRASNYLERFFK